MSSISPETLPLPPREKRRLPEALRFGAADIIGLIAIASNVVVVCMWIRTGGLQTSTSGFDHALGSLGLVTGLLSANLMLLQVLAVARIPWVERAWGHDLLMHRHKTFGYWSFWLMIVHVLLYAIERGNDAGAGWLNAQYELFIQNSWFLFATIGTVLLIGVVVTSIRWARRRLRYESWHLLHLYSYLGMGMAFPHMLADGMHFHDPRARAYWWFIYLFTLAMVLIYRLAWPAWRSYYHRLRVTNVSVEAPDVVSVTVEGRHMERLRTKSGQFFIWRFMGGPGWSRGNPYTISDAPDGDRLRVTIQAAGDGSARAAELEPGTRVAIEGPYGTMTAERRTQPHMLVLAAGVGVTPMRALIADTPYVPGEATLIYRYSNEQSVIFRQELLELADRRGFELKLLPGHRASEGAWLPEGQGDDEVEVLERLAPNAAKSDVFICGPPAWIASVKRTLCAAGVARKHIHTEDFAW